MLDLDTAWRFACALGFGMLIGLERERAQPEEQTFAGVRTFTLFCLLGATAGFAGDHAGTPWVVVAVFGAVAALVACSYVVTLKNGDVGMTTEVSALLTVLIGVLCSWGQVGVAAAITVACMLLLARKTWLHGIARRIESTDVEATLRFAIITAIVLPLLPNRGYGPPGLEAFNPFTTWLMVVLIAGLNFAGYILVKVLGREHGFGIAGVLGGLVSSTAVTLGFSQRSKHAVTLAPFLALGILLSWTVMFVRVVVEVWVVNTPLASRLALGLGVMGAASLAASLVLWRRHRGASSATAEVETGSNPFELDEAIKFGVLFGVVLFAARLAQSWFGDAGLYLAGALAGLTDVDAIALSMADLARSDPESAPAAARTVVIAVLANTLVKSGMVLWLGHAALRRVMAPVIVLLVVASGLGASLVG